MPLGFEKFLCGKEGIKKGIAHGYTFILRIAFCCYNELLERPNISDNTNNTRKMKNRILAIPAAPAATPPKPKMAAIIATIRNITVQRNIRFQFIGYQILSLTI
jgi:hypothetical protein